MRLLRLFISFCLLLALYGCAAVQKPIHLSSETLSQKDKRIGLLYTEPAKATTSYTGSIGLLDYAIIASANQGLDKHLETLKFPEYEDFIRTIKEDIEKNGGEIVIIDTPLTRASAEELKAPKEGKSNNNFSTYQNKYNLDMLLLINFKTTGTTRSYYGFIPTSEPTAQTIITGQLVDLNTNQLLWYSNSISQKVISSPWDESDIGYPNLTSSVYQSLNDTLKAINYELEGNTPLNVVADSNP